MDQEHSRTLSPPSTLKTATLFVVLALGFASTYWLLVRLAHAGSLPFSMSDSLAGTILKGLLRDFGPAVAAMLAAGLTQGRLGLLRLGSALARWRIPVWIYLIALALPFLADGIVVVVGVQTGALERGSGPFSPLHFLLVFFAMAVVDGPLGEEIGWRGLLLPELLRRVRPLTASLLVGAVWCLWHVPLYLADGRPVNWPDYLAGTIAYSIVFTWFYLRSGGSILLSVLLHNTTNFAIYLLLLNLWTRTGEARVPRVTYDIVWFAIAGIAAAALWRTPPTLTAPT
jgi:membrane protease YdiL (CAAX protease family)